MNNRTRLPDNNDYTRCVSVVRPLIKVQRSQAIMRRSVFFRSRIPFIPVIGLLYFLAILGMAAFIDVERELSTDPLETLAVNGLVMGTDRVEER